MRSKKLGFALGLAPAFSIVLACVARPALADSPEPVWRTFGVLVSGVTDVDSELVPDFLGPESKSVTVLPDAEGIARTFYFKALPDAPEGHPLATDTIWHLAPAHHAAKGPTADLPFFWLATETVPEPPPVGAHTFTGTDIPLIDAQVRYLAKPCTSADVINLECTPSDVSNGHWHFSTQTGEVFVIVTALFSK